MYDHGNWDYDHGKIIPESFKEVPYQCIWNVHDPLKKQSLHKEFCDLNKARLHKPNRKIAPYCSLSGKSGCGHWAFHRTQQTSSKARRRYLSTANKKTRQYLKEELVKELLEC